MVKNHLQKEADEPLRSDSESPHFFRIIVQETLQKLDFPKRFIRLYGEKLSDAVRLRVPTGDVWEMELQRCNGSVWLEKSSWASFASFYSLGFGYLVVFRLVELGISEFEVLIFDNSTVGINYPRVNCSIKAESSDSGFMQDQELVIRSGKKSLRDHDELALQMNPLKKMKISKASSSNLEKVQQRDHNKNKMHRLNSMEKEEALARAESFQSTNPYFKLVMQPSYVNYRYNLCLPIGFMQTYMPDNTVQLKLVCASNGKTWITGYYFYKANQAMINYGWDAFAKENQLVVGDVCVFELINGAEGEVSFKVTIFRAPRAAKSKTVQDEVALTSNSVPRHPFFQIGVQHSSTTLVTVPADFAKRHFDLEKKEQMLTLEVGDRSWSVKLLIYKRKSVFSYMSAGVSAFIKGNSLKMEDLCTFELIDSKEMVFKVSISRNSTVKE